MKTSVRQPNILSSNMPLVTRKGIYRYKYTDSLERMEDKRLPRKRDFYSTLTETGVKESDFEHGKYVCMGTTI